MSEWTDELISKVVKEYEENEPTPETSMDIVRELAEKYEQSPNGIRVQLSRAGVYIKKTPAKTDSKQSTGSKRVNKAEALDTLKATIKKVGQEVDVDIIDRLTGKAAVYFDDIISKVANQK